MIYKFIDNNGSEISVNSLESLQALVDSDTIKESTKIKAGLRGKWTTASEIDGLNFASEEEIQNTTETEEDIKSFITQSESPPKKEEIKEIKEEAVIPENKENRETDQAKEIYIEKKNERSLDIPDSNSDKFENNDNIDNLMAPNLPQAVRICFKKYFDFKGRASRSEYWYFVLFTFLGYGVGILLGFIAPVLLWSLGIFVLAIIIPAIAVAARRLHDINKSGWYQALPLPFGFIETIFAMNRNAVGEIIFLIIGIGIYIYLLILFITEGDSKKNRFGKNPLKKTK